MKDKNRRESETN